MSEKFDTDLDQLEVDKKIYEQAIQNLYNARDLLACLPDHGYIQIGLPMNAVDQAINATEAYGDRFLEGV
jgi:hypothetical protein|tara:strand:+ start:481 stop:690 length:210 start_codon:yes stop_codon:yes gene_type:complete